MCTNFYLFHPGLKLHPPPPACPPLLQEWEALQQSIQRRERALLETKSKVTHPAYSLYFPEEKQEWWWLYIADRRDQTLVSMPYHVCTLKDTEEVRPSRSSDLAIKKRREILHRAAQTHFTWLQYNYPVWDQWNFISSNLLRVALICS